MFVSIDAIIKSCEAEYKLEITAENVAEYFGFLQRQLDVYKEHINTLFPAFGRNSQQAYFKLLVDKLLLFAYLTRRKKVRAIANDPESETLIDSWDKIPLLKSHGIELNRWPDQNLAKLYGRREYSNFPKIPRYVALINEIGQDPEVASIWGEKIVYNRHMRNQSIVTIPPQ